MGHKKPKGKIDLLNSESVHAKGASHVPKVGLKGSWVICNLGLKITLNCFMGLAMSRWQIPFTLSALSFFVFRICYVILLDC